MSSNDDKLSGVLNMVFRLAGIQLSTIQQEKIKDACKDLESTIGTVAELKAREVCVKLQEATLEGFELLEDELKHINKQLGRNK